MAHLNITLFGHFSVNGGEQHLPGLGLGKTQELFCYLLLHRDRPISREALATMLWGEVTTARSKAYLRTALWKLQSAFRTSSVDMAGRPLLVTGPEWVQCHPDLDLWLDVEHFEEAYQRAEGVPVAGLTSADVNRLEEAVDLYEGDLLESYYQEWCLYRRERLRHLYLVMLDKIADYWERHHRYDVATSYASRTLALDRAREYTYRQLMRLRAHSGDRTGALREFQHCVAALREELDAVPSEATRRLYDEIRSGNSGQALEIASPRRQNGSETAVSQGMTFGAGLRRSQAPAEVVSDLKKVLDALGDVQAKIRGQVDALERQLRA